jgi:hypothetical protein
MNILPTVKLNQLTSHLRLSQLNIHDDSASIIAPLEFEKLCRSELKNNPRISCLPVQMLTECSMKKQGMRCIDAYKMLGRKNKYSESYNLFKTALTTNSVKLSKREKMRNYINLPDHINKVFINSHAGKNMIEIRNALNTFTLKHNKTSPRVALILLAIYRYKLNLIDEITNFLDIFDTRPSDIQRIIKLLANLGLVAITTDTPGGCAVVIITETQKP